MFESLLKDQVQGLMRILGQTDGLAPFQSYREVTASSYNTATGSVSNTTTDYADIPMVLARYESAEIDGSKIQVDDQKAIIADLDLPVRPSRTDKIVLADGSVWNVENVGGVPGESVWVLQIRLTE